jgi:hypothetical protein
MIAVLAGSYRRYMLKTVAAAGAAGGTMPVIEVKIEADM